MLPSFSFLGVLIGFAFDDILGSIVILPRDSATDVFSMFEDGEDVVAVRGLLEVVVVEVVVDVLLERAAIEKIDCCLAFQRFRRMTEPGKDCPFIRCTFVFVRSDRTECDGDSGSGRFLLQGVILPSFDILRGFFNCKA